VVRWLLVHPGPNFSVHDVFRGWSEALTALGEQVMEYNLDRRLTFYDAALVETGQYDDQGHPQIKKALDREQAIGLAADGMLGAAMRWWPHIILCTSAFFTPPFVLEVLKARGFKIVMLYTETPYQDDMQLKMAQFADLNLLNDPCTIERYRAVSPAEYMPHAYRPALHHPGDPDPVLTSDFVFVGTGYPSRRDFFRAMNLDDLDVLLAGNWLGLDEQDPLFPYLAHEADRCFDNEQTAAAYRSSKAGLNFYRREAEDENTGLGWAVGPREIEMAACGLWFMRDPRPESDELFPMLPAFGSPAEASELLHWWLKRDGYRWEAARKARAAIKDRTFTNHAKRLLELLDRQPVRR
jgi:spore maturation protein CgeB